MYMNIISDPIHYLQEMHENTNKYKPPEYLFKAKFALYPVATIYWSNVLTFLLYLFFLKFTDKFYQKMPTNR